MTSHTFGDHKDIKDWVMVQLHEMHKSSSYLVSGFRTTNCSCGQCLLATYVREVEDTRLLNVACGMSDLSSLMAVQNCWIMAGTGTDCCLHRSGHPKYITMGATSSEYVGKARPAKVSTLYRHRRATSHKGKSTTSSCGGCTNPGKLSARVHPA